MIARPLHFRAIDRLAALGNRSTSNPFLAAAFDAFFLPFGIRAKWVEFAAFECGFGRVPPLYAVGPRFDFGVCLAGGRASLFYPLRDAVGLVDVTILPGLEISWRQRAPVKPDDLMTAALLEAVGPNYRDTINGEIRRSEEYFRGFINAAVRVLAAPSGCDRLQLLFLKSPAGFVAQFLTELAAFQAAS